MDIALIMNDEKEDSKIREYGKKASEKLTAEKEDVLQMFRFNDN